MRFARRFIHTLTVEMEGASPAPPSNYFFSYEYSQITEEIRKLNEKMDTILERVDNALALQKKQKRSTIAEVNSKVDNLLEVIEKKQKVEYI